MNRNLDPYVVRLSDGSYQGTSRYGEPVEDIQHARVFFGTGPARVSSGAMGRRYRVNHRANDHSKLRSKLYSDVEILPVTIALKE